MESEGVDKQLLNYIEAMGRIAATDDGKTMLNYLKNSLVDMSCLRSGLDSNAIIWHSAQKELIQELLAHASMDIDQLTKNAETGGLLHE